jgi:flagellar motor component MotA
LSETGLFSLELRRMRARPFMKRSTRLLAMGIISQMIQKIDPTCARRRGIHR